jgi:hypothetical protein
MGRGGIRRSRHQVNDVVMAAVEAVGRNRLGGPNTETAVEIHERAQAGNPWITLAQVKAGLGRLRSDGRVTLYGVFGDTSWGLPPVGDAMATGALTERAHAPRR